MTTRTHPTKRAADWLEQRHPTEQLWRGLCEIRVANQYDNEQSGNTQKKPQLPLSGGRWKLQPEASGNTAELVTRPPVVATIKAAKPAVGAVYKFPGPQAPDCNSDMCEPSILGSGTISSQRQAKNSSTGCAQDKNI